MASGLRGRCALSVRRVTHAASSAWRKPVAKFAIGFAVLTALLTSGLALAANAPVTPAAPLKVVAPAPVTPADPLPEDARGLYAAARMWSTKHRDDLAQQAITKALLIAPDNAQLLGERMRIELRLGDARAAQAALVRLQQRAPDALATQAAADEYRVATSGREELATIRLLSRSGQSAEAARRIVALFPHGVPSGSLGAEYYQIIAGRPEGRVQAVDALRRRVAADPSDLDAALVLAGLLNSSGATRAEANRLAWRVAERPDADHAAALNVWRHVLQSAGADPDYLDALRAWLVLVPDDTEFKDRVATVEAQLDAQRRLERDPDYIARQRGLQALARGDLATAAPLLVQAAHARPDDAEAVGGLGLLRMREGQRDEARGLFLRAASLDADNRAKWQGLARTAQFWGTLAQGREAAAAGRARDAETAARAALALDPDSPDAKLLLADALLAQHDWASAEPLLRGLLAARAPDLSALTSMQTLLDNTGRTAEVGPLFEALRSRFADPADQRRVDTLRGTMLANEAQQLAAHGENGPAAQRYEASLRLAPDEPWTRYALARLYRDLGLPQLGREVMDDGLALSGSAEMRYAAALYRNSIDDVAGAQQALASIDDTSRSDAMRALARKLDAEAALADARTQFAHGDHTQAEATLTHAEQLAAGDPDMLAAVGTLWIDEGEPAHGLALLHDWIAAHPDEADIDVRLRYGDLLGNARRDAELDTWLTGVRARGGLDAHQAARLEDQALRLLLRQADAALADEDYALARATLARASAAGQRDPRYALELADIERAQGHYAAARAALAPLLAATPGDADAQLALARIDEDSGARRAALALVREVVEQTSADAVDTRLSAARRLVALGEPQEAEVIVDTLRVSYPAQPDVTVQAGRIAQSMGQFGQAASLYRLSMSQEQAAGVSAGRTDVTPAQAALADLEQRRDPLVETGVIPGYKSGDAGVSAYHAWQVPVYVQTPYGYDGHFFAHIDTVRIDAGTLPVSNWPYDIGAANLYARDTFGTFGALSSNTVNAIEQAIAADPSLKGDLQRYLERYAYQPATGVALGTGYVSDAWRFDIGTTPLGFPVHYLVGGVRYRFDAGPASFSVSASRRPETSSELSYAGMHDPVSGAVWGGVRRDGIDLHSSVDIGRINLFADLGAGELTGRNVASNQEVTLRTGFMVPVWQRAGMRVNTGLVGNAWHYTDNLRYYSFGQGGYYSPQRYLSLGVPIEWQGRRDKFTWDVTATVGISNSYEKDSPYFPNGLPRFVAVDLGESPTGSNFVYGGSSTQGVSFSYGVSGVVQYRWNAHLVVGARVQIDHSHDYAPSAGMVYLRYSFDARKDDRSLSPTPVRLYSSF